MTDDDSGELSVKAKTIQPQVIGVLGVGLDGSDGHHRLTRAEDAVLIGGSEETHERMQETVIKVSEALKRKGMRIREASVEELNDLIREARK
jgi:hypothetical protein